MLISEVKTAFKIAEVVYIPNSTKLEFKYLEEIYDENGKLLPNDILTKNYARVYLIVVDGETISIALYKRRYVIERANAWQDQFKALIIRYETRADTWLNLLILSFTVIFIRRINKKNKS